MKQMRLFAYSAGCFSAMLILGFGILCIVSPVPCYSEGIVTFKDALELLLVVLSFTISLGAFVTGAIIAVRSSIPYKALEGNIVFNALIGTIVSIVLVASFAIFEVGSIFSYPITGYLPFIFAGAFGGAVVWKLSKPARVGRNRLRVPPNG